MSSKIKDVRPKLIVGLGNPGEEYRYTRHNVGAWFVHSLGVRYGGEFKADRKFHGEVAEIFVDGHKLRLLFPTTYMNLSGQAVRALADYYNIESEEVLVAHDELDIPVGAIRLKFSGGHGGHNGLRDTSQHIGKDYWRFRIGVDHPGNKKQVSNYLTKNKPSRKEEELLLVGIKKAVDELPQLLSNGYEKTMLKWHTKPAKEKTDKESVNKIEKKESIKSKPIKEVNLIKRSSREGRQMHAKTAFAMALEKAKKEEE